MPALDSPPVADDAIGVTDSAPGNTPNTQMGTRTRLALAAASALLLTAAHEPVGWYFLAWVALVPLLLALAGATRARAALIGFVAAFLHASLLLHWIWHSTIVGSIGLMSWVGTYGAVFAALVPSPGTPGEGRGEDSSSRLPGQPHVYVLAVPALWTAMEWVRSWLFTGFPFAMISHSQIGLTTLCQSADFGGEFAVTFYVVAFNAAVALAILHRRNLRLVIPCAAGVIALLAGAFFYGRYRLSESETAASDGPTVMLVQSNFPHARGGAKTVTFDQQIQFHFDATERALAGHPDVDLVAWSETVLPAMNPEALARSRNPEHSTLLHQRLIDLTRRYHTPLVFGAYALLNFPANPADADVRTSAYFYSPELAAHPRYDKVHLVPFGEIVPFRHSIPWLHRLFFRFAAYSVDYVITPGPSDALTVFPLPGGERFVTPICFEDLDGRLLRRMLAPQPDGQKRADFILNVTNDGWFNAAMKQQHLAGAAFRSIENRVWTARVCNTGISGFIDSSGRFSPRSMLPADTQGVKVGRVGIDPRITPYARVGDRFAMACCVFAVGGVATTLMGRRG